jgi:hypothetical protein
MITYNDVMLARMVFEKFWEQELPFETAEKVENFLLEFNIARDAVMNKQNELLDKYAERDDNGNIKYEDNNGVILKDMDSFIKEFNSFLDTEFNYNFDEDNYLTKKDLKYLKCTPKEVENVTWCIRKK